MTYSINILKKIICFTLFMFSVINISGQITAESIRNRMWNSGDPDFKVTDVPEKWKNESVVILCKSITYEYRKQVMAGKVNNDFYLRQRIKLLDKTAVNEFSEFSFKELNEVSFSREGAFLGVKIIKSDGTVRIININDAVRMQLYQNSKETRITDNGYYKLAIPYLEPGDIIDYYYVLINTYSTANKSTSNKFVFDPVFISLPERYPIIKGKIKFLPERKCFINLSVSNGAPIPVIIYDNNKDYYMIEFSDLDKIKQELWFYPFRQEPTIKFQIITGPKYVSEKEKYFLGQHETPKTSVSHYEFSKLLNIIEHDADENNTMKDISLRFLKKQKPIEDTIVLLQNLFYYLRHFLYFQNTIYYGYKVTNNYLNDHFDFISVFSKALKILKIDHKIFLGTQRNIGIIDSVVLLYEITPFIEISCHKKPVYIFYPGIHSVFGETNYLIENTKIYGFDISNQKHDGEFIMQTIPQSNKKDNLQIDTVNISFDSISKEKIKIYHKIFTLGGNKEMFQLITLTPNDYYNNEYDHYFKIKKIKSSEQIKIHQKLNGIKNKKSEFNKSRKEIISEWLKENHMLSEMELDTVILTMQGRFSNDSALIFECKLSTSDLIKKAGNYLILEAGKFIGKNIDLNKEEKERETDIYMPFPRQYEWIVSIEVPEGYMADNIDNLNYNVINKTGGFVSSTLIEKNKVIIHVTKHYNNNYEPLENWNNMLEFLEAANDFVQQKLVLKKIN